MCTEECTPFNPLVSPLSLRTCICWVTTPRCELSSHVVNRDLAGVADSSETKINKKQLPSKLRTTKKRRPNIQNTRICYTWKTSNKLYFKIFIGNLKIN